VSVASPAPPSVLRAGRRALDGVRGVEILRDLAWHEPSKAWILHVRVRIDPASDAFVPATSDWFVHIDPHYPLGRITLYPAKEGGLHATFPHQSYNDKGSDSVPWRSGNLCLGSPYGRALGRWSSEPEPHGAHDRLKWHVERARDWLDTAARGALLAPGDPYELPAWPGHGDITVVYAESARTFAPWSLPKARAGGAVLIAFGSGYRAVERWTDLQRRPVAERRWGYVVTERTARSHAVWLLLADTPRLPPWQAPRTWGELRAAARAQNINIDTLLRQVVPRLRGKGRTVLLIGFPIPEKVGGRSRELCWKALLMPALEGARTRGSAPPRRAQRRTARGRVFPGFRDNGQGRWMRDRYGPLRDELPLEWLKSENWHSDRIGARGRYMEATRRSRVAILGVGALGSLMADLLVRGGVEDVLLVDDDSLVIGNLVRHRLRMEHLTEHKAEALAEELNLSSPHARVRALSKRLPLDPVEAQALLEDRTILIDCTGDDALLRALARCRWATPKLFVSISVGYEAKRLYFFAARDARFPMKEFEEPMARVLSASRSKEGERLPWEGAGCWDPYWPGRLDDLMLMAATASKLLESVVEAPEAFPMLQVFERRVGPAGMFGGVERIDPTAEGQAA
jgi:lactate dehydrogenase-like 2-hydroxyacid dehydrogenase